MTTAERRREILQILSGAGDPVAARDLAARFGVSRQVIVQDLAVIRASHPHIISTYRGYVMQQPESGFTREFKVRHGSDRTEEELNLIVDHGGWVKNISISHRVYGRMTADLDISCRQDVQDFLQSLAGSFLTGTFHGHGRLSLPSGGGGRPGEAGQDRGGPEAGRLSGASAALGEG